MKYLLFSVFIIIPIAEIATFIRVGDIIGLWPTLGIILFTAFLGTGLLRYQGIATLNQAQACLNRGEIPLDSVVHGLFLLVAGLLLLTPGFITDAIGFLLFIPPLRLLIARWALEKLRNNTRTSTFSHTSPTGSGPGPAVPPIIEGEFTISGDEGDDTLETRQIPKNDGASDSPWRQ